MKTSSATPHNREMEELEELETNDKKVEHTNTKLDSLRSITPTSVDALLDTLKNRYNINRQDEFGDSPLHVAVGQGRLKCAYILIKAGADVNVRRSDGYSILHTAAERGYEKLTKLLIQQGAVVNARTDDGETPLHYAVCESKPQCVKLLLDHGASVNLTLSNVGTTALHLAASRSPDCIEQLLKANADIFTMDCNGVCPLEVAMEVGVSRFLTMCSGNLDVRSKGGVIPLHLAAHCLNGECLDVLIKNGHDVNCTTIKGDTPLHYVSMLEMSFNSEKVRERIEIAIERNIRFLLRAGAHISKKNNAGLTPLHVSVKCGQSIAARYFLIYGTDVNIQGGEKKQTALHLASEEGNLTCIKFLLECGACKNVLDVDNNTALMLAAKNAQFESVKILLENNVPLWVNTEMS